MRSIPASLVRTLIPYLLIAWLAACAAPPGPTIGHDPGANACEERFAALDRAVSNARVGWSQAHAVPGYPYLRVSRFLASYGNSEPAGAQWESWVDALRDLDRRGRRLELARLDLAARGRLGIGDPDAAVSELDSCARTLRRRDLASSSGRRALLAAARVPDDYSFVHRVLGFYPLTFIPVAEAIRRYHNDIQRSFELPAGAIPVRGKLIRFGPIRRSAWTLPRPSPVDALGVPRPDENGLEALYLAHAPVFEIDQSGDYDRPGRPYWKAPNTPDVDVRSSTVYRFPSWTRWYGRALLQLNYVVWFRERPPRGRLDILAGRLDGVVWRVTLDPSGQPLVYDAVHACGCYHMFFPSPTVSVRRPDRPEPEPPLIPQVAPTWRPGHRVVVRLSSGAHHVQRIQLTSDPTWSAYELAPYEDLYRTLGPNGRPIGLFSPNGLISGTERPERFLLWPMGVRSAGAMRGVGRHAIAFVGRRHFDDPNLLERYFDSRASRAE